MTWHTLNLQPGVDTQSTPTLNTVRWTNCNLIRFKEGLLQCMGGWQHLNSTKFVGTARGMHGWASLTGVPYVAIGTEQRLQIFDSGQIEDITPYRTTTTAAANFSTSIGSPSVTVTVSGNGASVGDWVYIFITASVGGLILQGFYQVQTIIDGNNFTINAGSNATTNVTNGGSLPQFTTTNTSTTVLVTLANHGLTTGQLFQVQVTTAVGGTSVAAGLYSVTVLTGNTFNISVSSPATSSTTATENGGNERYNFLIPTGEVSNTPETGYGIGLYGAGPYGMSSGSSIIVPLRQWFLDNWGQDLIGNYTQGPIYVWTPPFSANTPAVLPGVNVLTGNNEYPLIVNTSFVAMPERILMAFGCDPYPQGSAQDPNLIRWSNVDDFTAWVPTTTNFAGSFRIPTGSQIVGSLQGPQFGILWTDVDCYVIQYLGFPLVFGFNKISGGCELISARAAGIYQSSVYWCSRDNFIVFDGNSVQVLPCSVWDAFFTNLNTQQLGKVFCAVNSVFNEIFWFYPSASGSGEVDSYVKYNTLSQCWDLGTLIRTAWIDVNPLGTPIGADTSGLLQQHEIGNTADGVPLVSFAESGAFMIAEGEEFSMIERIAPDFILSGGNQSVTVMMSAQDYPFGPTTSTTPQVVTNTTQYLIQRIRGRSAFLTVTGNQSGVFWRLGAVRYVLKPAGLR